MLRLAWVVATIPLWVIASLLPPARRPRAPRTWSVRKRVLIPLVGRIVWSITYGIPPRFYQYLTPPYGGIYKLPNATVEVLKVPTASRKWYQGASIDCVNHVIRPVPVPAYWISPFHNLSGDKKLGSSSRSAQVVLVLAGGGYVEGHPLEGRRCYDVAQRTQLKVLGINYRKAVLEIDTFPAALQDAISAYAYLIGLGYERIAIVGDSAGGGLAMTLSLYLASLRTTLQNPPLDLLPPSHLILISPWVDLTLSTESIDRNVDFDVINPTMLATSAWAYTRNTTLLRSDPLLSPSLQHAIPILTCFIEWANPSILLIYGTAEILCDESEHLSGNFQKAQIPSGKLTVLAVEDETHVFPILPTWISEHADWALDRIASFITANSST